MSNLSNEPKLITCRVDKGNVDENSLYNLLASDSDFLEVEDMFREDTLSLGFLNEAERVSKEIFEKHKDIENECERVTRMFREVFNVSGFVGKSSCYGGYEDEIIETEFEYILIIATIM